MLDKSDECERAEKSEEEYGPKRSSAPAKLCLP